MGDPLGDLHDREAIRHLLNLYCRAFDRQDWDLVRAVYWPDAYDDHGAYKGGIEGLIEYAADVMSRAEANQHTLGTSIIEVEGDEAHCESYFVGRTLRKPEPDGRQLLTEMYGRYVDRFEKRDGEWRIAHRVCVLDMRDQREQQLTPSPVHDEMVRGRRDRSDAIYQRPLATR
ncbi:MAG: nuclear transport factor 2 family protein [Acidimicrobiia bacterium]